MPADIWAPAMFLNCSMPLTVIQLIWSSFCQSYNWLQDTPLFYVPIKLPILLKHTMYFKAIPYFGDFKEWGEKVSLNNWNRILLYSNKETKAQEFSDMPKAPQQVVM